MLYSDEVTLTSGTTADTFGTAGTITLGNQARRVLGIVNSGCLTTYITAEGSASVLQMVCKSLGIASTQFSVGPYLTSGPAANAEGAPDIQEVIPLDIPCAGGEIFSFQTAPTSTMSNANSNMVQLLYSDNDFPPADWLMRFPSIVPIKDGYESDAQQLTTTRTALTAITVPSWAREIVGIKVTVIKTGAITAAQYDQVVVELTGTIPNMTPNKWISNSNGATLGTPVGIGTPFPRVEYIPMWIPLSGRTETITPYVNLVSAVSTGNKVQVGLVWR